MRYEDASGAGQASGPIANDDADALSAGQRGPATGNLITGEGTQYGSAGADSAAGAHITAIAGKGGEDSSFSGGKLSVAGEHGRLTVDADGNYSYLASGNVENVRDRFTYTLADSQGNSDTAALIVEIGKTPAVIKADAQQIVPGPDGVVTLPPGVELSDIRVVGRNLVVDLPDGTQLIILDGAVFVPQLVLGGVEIPATNVATLLIGQEPQPAAGETPPSSGGNFALPPPPLDPGVPLGDLIPPTEFDYVPPEPEEVLDTLNREPEISIQPDGQPASVNAVDSVDEKGLPTRNEGEPEGSGEEAAPGADGDPSEATIGTIIIDSPDGVDSVTINGVLVTGAIGQEIDGDFGTLTITGFDGDNILYSYVLNDNTSGNDTQDDFEVVLTDEDGDTATATLTIDIIDDVPFARPDTDAIAAGQFGPVTGNVLTDASAGDAGDSDSGADTVGADDADLTAVTGFGSTTPFEGGWTVIGQYGVLTINTDGSYSYTRNPGTPGGVNDVFNYTLTDGDGDPATTTLTISIADTPPSIDVPVAGEEGTEVDEKGLPTRNGGEPAGSGEIADGNGAGNDDGSETTSGVVNFTPGDGPATIRIDGVAVTSVGQTFTGDHGVLTITAIGPNSVSYSYTLGDNTSGDTTSDSFAFSVTDSDGDVANGNLVIDIIDDVPSAVNDTDLIPAGSFEPATGNVITDAAAGDAGDSDNGADTAGADNATISGLASVNVPANVDNDAAGGFVVNGQYGVLTMQADGSYSYVRNPGTPGGVNDVFTYSLTDGDGDVDTATLTIEIGDARPNIPTQHGVNVVSEAGLPTRNGGEPAGTGEIADGDGTNNSDTSETISGSATISGGDGPLTVTIDGVVLTSVGQTFVKPNGVLTITAINAGSIDYTFTLTDNTSGNATNVSYAVVVTDQDGDTASGTFIIDIVDDAPSAVNDTDGIGSGGSTATGNVITDASPGDAGDSDNGADTVGADNSSITGLASNNVPANVDNDPAGGFVVVGQHGTLTMQADGTYSYVRSNDDPGSFQDVFTYTLTDSDGDSDTATLTIDISDAPTSLDVPTQGEAGTLVSEVGLPTRNGGEPAGTGEAADGNSADNDDASETTGGVISFTAPDAPATVTIDGVAVSGTVGQTFNGAHGVLTITSYNAATGQIGYSYTLTDNTDGNATFDDFAVVVTDNDGDSSSATLTINIVDDAPIAADDTDSIAAGQYGPATGNVITDAAGGDSGDSDNGKDNVGADNAQVSQIASNNVPANVDITPSGGNFVVNGQYGVLTIGQDGNYSYIRNPGTPGGVQDVFTYTLTDGDGDTDTATLTITIANSPVTIDAPDEGEAGTIVDEKGLPTRNGGEPAGTGEAADGDGADNDDSSETTAGVISFSAPDAPATITIDGVAVTGVVGQTFNGAHGVLTITSYNAATGQVGYSYTLGDNTSGNATFDDFAIQITDADGDVASDTLVIDIIDDQPLAANDTDTIVGGLGPATGNVITDAAPGDAGDSDSGRDNVGADNAVVSAIASNNVPANIDTDPGANFEIAGQYGVLTLNADGSYSYLRNEGSPGGVQDVFTYTLTDGDGDTTTATLTISIEDNVPGLPDPDLVSLDDDVIPGKNGNVPDGPGDEDPDTVGDNVVNGQLSGSGGDGELTYNFTGLNSLPPGMGFTVNDAGLPGMLQVLQNGTLVMTITLDNDTGAFTITQNNPIVHPTLNNAAGDDSENNLDFSIGVEVEDGDGDTEPASISINVDDDTPTINVTKGTQTEPVLTTQDAETDGNPTNEDVASTTAAFGGMFGLTASAGADGGAAAPLSFALAVTNSESGLASHGAAINLFLIGGKVVGSTADNSGAVNPGNTIFDIAVAADGTVTLTQYQQVDHGVEGVTTSPFDDQFAALTDGKVTLTASSSITDGDGDTVSDQEVIDLGGNIRFADDGPDAVNDSVNQATENSAVTVNVFANDALGADGVNVVGGIAVVPGSLTGAGSLVYNNNGTFTYTPVEGEQGSISFQYKITDFDGDTDTATVTINLQPDSVPAAVDGVAKVDDDGLVPNGNNDSATGDNNANDGEAATVNPSEAVWHGQLVAAGGGDTIVDYDFAAMHGNNGTVGTETVSYSWNNATSTLTATTVGGTRPGTELFNLVVNQANGSYNLTLVNNVLHANEVANQENDATTNLTFTVTDSDGDQDTGQIVVTFDDDMPVVTDVDTTLDIPNVGPVSGTGDFDFDIGADQNSDNDDIFIDPATFTVSVNDVDATNVQFNTGAETATTASYTFSFDYDAGTGGIKTANGTLTFDKAAGTYTVTLDAPIEGFSIDSVQGQGGVSTPYPFAGDPEGIRVVEIEQESSPGAEDGFFIQFKGQESTSGPNPFGHDDQFSGTATDVHISSTDIGVHGNAVQPDEVLDFEFMSHDPQGTDEAPSATATGAFIQIEQFNGTEDFIIVLKLADPADPSNFITRTIVVQSSDVITNNALVPDGYPSVNVGASGQGIIIIEPVDYLGLPGVPDNYQIAGMQFRSSTEGLPAAANEVYNFDGDVGETQFDYSTTNFTGTTDNDVFKIRDIGVVRESTTNQSATINFDVVIEDSDGDQVTQSMTVNIGEASETLAATTFAAQEEQLQKTAANSNALTMAAAVAASGMSDSAAAEPTYDPAAMRTADISDVNYSGGSVEKLAADDDEGGNSSTAAQPEASEAEGATTTSGHGRGNANGHDGKLDAGSNHSSSDGGSSHQAANDQGPAPAAEPQVAAMPTVMMAAAEQLQAASLDVEVKQNSAIEQIMADALGGAPTVDGVLANLPGGIGELAAIANLASPAGEAVPGWDMAVHGAFGSGAEMLFKADAIALHHDAIQPVA